MIFKGFTRGPFFIFSNPLVFLAQRLLVISIEEVFGFSQSLITLLKNGTVARMNPNKIALAFLLMMQWVLPCPVTEAGVIISSTVNQSGYKIDFPGSVPGNTGSASRIGVFDFDFATNPSLLTFLQARIRFWVQLPTQAEGFAAPWIVLAKEGVTDQQIRDISLTNPSSITEHAIRTDIRITANQPDQGTGVVEKKMFNFEDLTGPQGLALSSILASNASHRLEAWLVSDTFANITVPAFGETFSFVGGTIVSTFQPFSSTLDLIYVPEPSSVVVFVFASIIHTTRRVICLRRRNSNQDKSKDTIEPCIV